MPNVTIDGATIAYRECGRGPLALFVHGFPLDSTMWLDVMEEVGDVRRCIAVDLRGCGASDPTRLPALTMEQHADDLANVLQELGREAADVIGLSMGGYVALALCERHPDWLRSLVLMDTRAGADSDAARQGRDAARERLLRDGRAAYAGDLIGALLAPAALANARARLRTMVEGTSYESILAMLEGLKTRADRRALLPRLRWPTTVVVGSEDRLTPPAEARALAEAIPGATCVEVPGAGHLSPLERPQEVAQALRAHFLRIRA